MNVALGIAVLIIAVAYIVAGFLQDRRKWGGRP